MVLKRLMAPGYWPIEKKTKKFVIDPVPGPHSKYTCIPVAVLLREVLHHARIMAEVKTIMNNSLVKIDGRVRKEPGFGMGIMDVLSIGDEHHRMIATKHGLKISRIDKKEAGIKLLRIDNKIIINKGKTQLNFHDGTNMLSEDNYKTGDVIVYDFNEKKIKGVIKLQKDTAVLVIKGNNIGSIGKVDDILVTRSSMENQVVVDLGERKVNLPKSYVFAVGSDKPVINLGEGA
ncbi:MAG: 30S ribosomal protein S4e [Candidatus Aenigmarchaeota archaeon]|nr:30S ribosomal protein S4e [Candidatus Aenigmarchaeota archaeon]